ncbi:MAG: hypothetical protein DLM55_10745 [Acidimicrobiales bacterium]|nr:MAG: hypothetical protein DLM55_10745 [Acidimicrobiales bacterium]
MSGITAAAIYGSFAARQLGESGQAPRDIDVLIVGEPNLDEMYRACETVSEIVKREVTPAVVSLLEWREASSGFLRNVRQAPIIPLAGDWISLMSDKAEEGTTRG